MTQKEYIISHVKPDDFYASRFPTWNARVRGNVRCPFHDDNGPSFSISLRGGGARCHGSRCQKRIGNIVHYESETKSIPERMAARKLYREFIRPVIPKKIVQTYRENLVENSTYLLRIRKEMGLSYEWVRKFNLGLDTNSQRITIPIYNQFGQCVNIRFYKLPSQRNKNDKAKIYNLEGHGGTDLFPYPALDSFNPELEVYFMASEKEAMLAKSLGLQAFCCTAGEGSWNDDYLPLIKDCSIILLLDTDAGGQTASASLQKKLEPFCRGINALRLSFNEQRKDRKDFADWILKEKHTIHELLELSRRFAIVAKNSKGMPTGNKSIPPSVDELWESDRLNHRSASTMETGTSTVEPSLPEFYSKELIDLSSVSSRVELLNYRICTQGIVAAKSTNTYSIPWRFSIEIKDRKPFEYALPLSRELLRFVKASDTSILQAMQSLVGSQTADVKPLDYLTVTEVEIIPTAVVDKDVPYVVQRCYYFGKRIEANIPYYLEIIPTSEIRTQETVGIITSFTALSKSIERFEITPEVIANLSTFWPDDTSEGGIWSKLTRIANDISTNITSVYNRLDWHLVALLTWASPIGWRFPNERELQRGWVNSLALGDTETGKSKVAKALRSATSSGVFVNAENCTYVGLVGGAIKMGSGQLMLRWGRIPLSDKQLVVLEELSGLSVDDIANMSDVRSSGIARLDKGGINSETNSRTRLLCLSNVRSERKNLANYLYGVHAIRELVGHGEDIARFDLITTLVDKEVSIDVINGNPFATVAKAPQEIYVDQLQQLIHFIWSLNPEQIKFTESAYECCLEKTKELSTYYHASIPIFKGGSGRYKIGRIAASIACLLFSYSERASVITVHVSHVLAAVKLLRMLYDKPSFGYKEYSAAMFDREHVKDRRTLHKCLANKIPRVRFAAVLETLIHSTQFTRDELCAIAEVSILHADQIIGTMVRERALVKGNANAWEITPAGKQYFEQLMKRYETNRKTN